MSDFNFNPGDKIRYLAQEYIVKTAIDLQKVLIINPINNTSQEVKIDDLEPIDTKNNDIKRELSLIPEHEWHEAIKREKILKPLMKSPVFTQRMAQKAGEKLALKQRQIYNLVKQYREGDYSVLSLLPKVKNKAGKGRIKAELEEIIHAEIKRLYLNKQRIRSSKIIEAVRLNCFNKQLVPPSKNTVLRRLANYCTDKELISKRFGAKTAKAKYEGIKGQFPQQQFPLQTCQIDHTVVDLIVVDELYRQPIGRPYITVVIDVYSRCITGFCLTLEPPSAMSVGLSLAHAVLDKEYWLAARKIEAEWPIWGKPERIYVDNAAEFHSEALQRGCKAHGIEIDYRPIGRAHYGGIVERVIGTLMQLVHQLPGTTFSNVKERGEYGAEQQASLTLSELEKWLTIAITHYYHKKLHKGLNKPPIEQYKEGILGTEHGLGCGYPAKIEDRHRFLIDFLPIEFRSLQREGFMLDHIAYYSNALSPFMANRTRYGKFLIRRDPRDLSKIYVLEPKSQGYIKISYRTLHRVSISLWEHKQALKYLRNQGLKHLDEAAIFQAVEEMREISKTALAKTKAVRRRLEITRKNAVNESQGVRQVEQDERIEPTVDNTSVIYEAEWW